MPVISYKTYNQASGPTGLKKWLKAMLIFYSRVISEKRPQQYQALKKSIKDFQKFINVEKSPSIFEKIF